MSRKINSGKVYKELDTLRTKYNAIKQLNLKDAIISLLKDETVIYEMKIWNFYDKITVACQT